MKDQTKQTWSQSFGRTAIITTIMTNLTESHFPHMTYNNWLEKVVVI